MLGLTMPSYNKRGYLLIKCHLKYSPEAGQLVLIDVVKKTQALVHYSWADLWKEGSGIKYHFFKLIN